jgi:hypothetical protein
MTTAPARPSARPVVDPFTAPAVRHSVTDFVTAEFTARVVTLSPGLAKEILRRNTRNRPIRPADVSKWARLMAAGKWHLNGEAFKIDVNGDVLDGQHRLLAVVKSGATIQILMVSGLAPEAQETMDSGSKRTTADTYSLRNEQNYRHLAAIARKVWLWDRGDRRFSAKENPSTPELTALLEEFPTLRRSADIAARVYNAHFRAIPPSVVGVAHHLTSRIAPDDATWFFQRLGDGAELPVKHPILTLRTRTQADKDRGLEVTDGRHLAQLHTVWNAVRAGKKSLSVIRVDTDTPVVEPK